MEENTLLQHKKGVSVVIGYVLLVVFAIVIAAGVYAWLKTYIPADSVDCPDGLSLFIKYSSINYSYNATHSQLNVTVRNNGRFDIAGYFIHGAANATHQVFARDLSPYLVQNSQGILFGNSVVFSVTGANSLTPGSERTNTFLVPTSTWNTTALRVIPTRFQEEDNRQRFVSCADAASAQAIGAGGVCVPNCSGRACGNDGCGGICGVCSTGLTCDPLGQCINQSGGGSLCGNGALNAGEQCDDGNIANGDGCNSNCIIDPGWTCSGVPSVCTPGGASSCPTYCVLSGFATGYCTNSVGNCQAGGGSYQSAGDQWCTGGSQADTCCCQSVPYAVLFSDGFEGYTTRYGNQLYTEMNTNGWVIVDAAAPLDDDVYLNGTSPFSGFYAALIQNDAQLVANVSSTGRSNVTIMFTRKTLSLEGSEALKFTYRVGGTGSWTQLEGTSSTTWQTVSFVLPSTADNQPLIQLRFWLDSSSGGSADHGFIDLFNVTAT